MSLDTIGSSLYLRMPSKRPLSACSENAAFTSSALVSRDTSHTRSTTEPVITGARTAIPFSLPSSSGTTSPIALAAPVEVGTRFAAAARARRRSLCGPSCRFWSAVYAWIVVMIPRSIPTASCSTRATGPRQFVVQDAFEITWCWSGSYASSFTPSTSVTSGSVAGALMITFLAPASRCLAASSRFVKKPVDSITTSAPTSPHGSAPGLRRAEHVAPDAPEAVDSGLQGHVVSSFLRVLCGGAESTGPLGAVWRLVHVAVDHLHQVIAPGRVFPREMLGYHDRAVATAGAADRDRQVGLSLQVVVRQQVVEQRRQAGVELAHAIGVLD